MSKLRILRDMKNKKYNIFALLFLTLIVPGFVSCSENDEGALVSEKKILLNLPNLSNAAEVPEYICFLCDDEGKVLYKWGHDDMKEDKKQHVLIKKISGRDALKLENVRKVYVVSNINKNNFQHVTSLQDFITKEVKAEEFASMGNDLKDFDSQDFENHLNYSAQGILDYKDDIYESKLEFQCLASKISMQFSFDNKYKPDEGSNPKVTLCNARKSTTIRPLLKKGEKFDAERILTKDKDNYTSSMPFYSFESDWEKDLSEEMFLLLEVPRNGGNKYYKISLANRIKGESIYRFIRNRHYKMSVKINTDGGENPSAPKELSCESIIKPLKEYEIETVISDPGYLIIEENFVKMYNQDEITLSYNSDSEIGCWKKKVEVQDTKDAKDAKMVELNNSNLEDLKLDGNCDKFEHFKVNVDVDKKQINFKHEMSRNKVPFRPFVITLFLAKKTDIDAAYQDNDFKRLESLSQKMVIKQYPERYIEVQQNSDYDTKFDYEYDGENKAPEDNRGYVYVENNNKYDKDLDDYKRVAGMYYCNNKNPNMYIVTVSKFGANSKLSVGDVREALDVSKGMGHNKCEIKDSDGKTLNEYRPTRSDDGVKNIVSPKIRIASSYGGSPNLENKDDAFKRCRGYQEDGYPAGRWRLPTPAELFYIVSLSNDKKIPKLFTMYVDGFWEIYYYYWTSCGQVNIHNNKLYYDKDEPAAVRCVYDEWYWGGDRIQVKGQPKKHENEDFMKFKWGDTFLNK